MKKNKILVSRENFAPYFNFLSLYHYSIKYTSPINTSVIFLKNRLNDSFKKMQMFYDPNDFAADLNDFSPHLFENLAKYSEKTCYAPMIYVSAHEEEIKNDLFLVEKFKEAVYMNPVIVECTDKFVENGVFPEKVTLSKKLNYKLSVVFCLASLVPCALMFTSSDDVVALMNNQSISIGKYNSSTYNKFFEMKTVIILAAMYMPILFSLDGYTTSYPNKITVNNDYNVKNTVNKLLSGFVYDEYDHDDSDDDICEKFLSFVKSPYTYFTAIGKSESEAYDAIGTMYYVNEDSYDLEERNELWSYFRFVNFVAAYNDVLQCYLARDNNITLLLEKMVRYFPFHCDDAKNEILNVIVVIASDKSYGKEKEVQDLLAKMFKRKGFEDIIPSLPVYKMSFKALFRSKPVKYTSFEERFRTNYKKFIEKKKTISINERYLEIDIDSISDFFKSNVVSDTPTELSIIP